MKQKAIIFGLGHAFKILFTQLELEYDIKALTDNSYTKFHTTKSISSLTVANGNSWEFPFTIVPPEKISSLDFDVVVITVIAEGSSKEISRQLVSLGIPETKIVPYFKNELIKDFDQLDELVEKWNLATLEGKNTNYLRLNNSLDFDSFVALFGSMPPECDPFSDEYSQWELSFFEFLAGRKYSFSHEGVPIDKINLRRQSFSAKANMEEKTSIARTQLYADFIEIWKPKRGLNVLEMGCGQGFLLEQIGRFECTITGLDVSDGFVEYAKRLLAEKRIDADIKCGTFYDIEKLGKVFDVVVFDGSFHHCGEPLRLLNLINEHTAPDCRVFFLREPITSDYDRPWGVVRYDFDTILQIRKSGWMELGFREDFFIEALNRAGFKHIESYFLPNMYSATSTSLYEARKVC